MTARVSCAARDCAKNAKHASDNEQRSVTTVGPSHVDTQTTQWLRRNRIGCGALHGLFGAAHLTGISTVETRKGRYFSEARRAAAEAYLHKEEIETST